MEERQLKNIKRYLQSEDVQKRLQQYMQRGRSEATISIGRVAQLFQLKESKLRDWETRGLLKPLRSKDISGQRQYSPAELDKLAIIKELVDEGGYAPSDIPQDIDSIWYSVSAELKDQVSRASGQTEHLHIEQRVLSDYKDIFWRYYASRVLRLSLMLIFEGSPDTIAGLVLPSEKFASAPIPPPEDLWKVGESLVGWIGQTRSFYTFLTSAPSFEYPSDYRILPLQTAGEDVPKDGTLIIVERQAVQRLNLSIAVVKIIRCLLTPLYEDVQDWQHYFGQGMRDLIDPALDFNSSANLSDIILNGLANMVIRLGGRTYDGQNRWRFCCIQLPNNLHLPLQQRSLVVRAQSKLSPHKVGVTGISSDKYFNSPSLRAYQSGHVIYRAKISVTDTSIA